MMAVIEFLHMGKTGLGQDRWQMGTGDDAYYNFHRILGYKKAHVYIP